MSSWMQHRNKRSIAIVRVSSRKQTDNTSHEVQEKEVSAYCKRNDLNLVKVFRITESARYSEHRKQYKSAIDFMLSQGVRHLLFYMQDREARNLKDLEDNEQLVKSDQIVIHYVHDRKVLDKNSSDTDFLTRDFNGVIHKQFSRLISAKVKGALHAKAESGWYPGGVLPLGYVHVRPKGPNGQEIRGASTTVAIDPNVANVRLVQREFELKARGYSLDKIREENIRGGYVPRHMIATYHRASIDCRLHNRFYCGKIEWDGQEYDGKHEPIISWETWEAVQIALRFGLRGNPKAEDEGIFSGFLRCGTPGCGCLITYERKVKVLASTGESKIYDFYHCNNARKVHPSLKGLYVSEESIWSQLTEAMRSISIGEELANEIAREINRSDKKNLNAARSVIDSAQSDVAALSCKVDRIFDLFMSGKLDEEEFEIQLERAKKDRRDASDKLNALKSRNTGRIRVSAEIILELAKEAVTLWKLRPPLERLAFVKRVISNQVLDEQTLRYDLKKPFAVLSEMKNSVDWYLRSDSN
jgi:site-specific DNA recombinase